MRTFVRASLRTHARRYIAVALAVMIATTFMITTNALGAAAKDGWRTAIAEEFESADAVLTGVPRNAVGRVGDVEGVRASGTIDSEFLPVTTGSLDSVASIGTASAAKELRWQDLVDGSFPSGPRQVLISTDRAEDAGVTVGDRLTVDDGARTRDFTIAGTVEPSVGDLGSSVYLTEGAMARMLESMPATVAVVFDEGGGAGALDALRESVPEATVQSADTYIHDLQLEATGKIDVMQKMLFVFVSIALIVAGLVIANTLAIVLAQRTRDFALLRCIGAKRRQITRSVLVEALVVAVIAAVLGVAAGFGLAYAGVAVVSAAWPSIPLGTPGLSLVGTAVPVVVSVAVALIAAVAPARRTNRLSPLAALRPEAVPTSRSRPGVVRMIIAGLFLATGFGAMAVAASSGTLPIAMVGGALSFVGILLLGPLLIPALIDGVRPLVGRLGGVPGRIAAANAVRNRRRTAATSAALLIGVTLISTVVVGTASMKGSVATEMDTRAPIDMILDGERPLDTRTVDRVGAIDGVDKAVELDGTGVTLGKGNTKVVAVGLSPDAAAVVRPEGELRDVSDGQVFLPMDLASGADLVDGDRVRLAGPDGAVELEVVTGTDWGTTAVVSANTLTELGGQPKPYSVWLRATDDADASSVVGELNAISGEIDGATYGSLPDRAQVMTALDVVLAVTVGLLGVAVVIAIVGVGNTLSLSVLERVRENALLRALGLRRGQQRSMLAIEALLMASVATVLGIVLGLAYAWFGIRTLAGEDFVTTPTVEIPFGQLVAVFVVAAVAGLLACVLPARRAAAIPPAAGLVAD